MYGGACHVLGECCMIHIFFHRSDRSIKNLSHFFGVFRRRKTGLYGVFRPLKKHWAFLECLGNSFLQFKVNVKKSSFIAPAQLFVQQRTCGWPSGFFCLGPGKPPQYEDQPGTRQTDWEHEQVLKMEMPKQMAWAVIKIMTDFVWKLIKVISKQVLNLFEEYIL
jgi:hypothetical protein